MNGIVGVAINPYVPQEDDKLQLNKGDFVKILEKSPDGWWRGEANGHSGWFPSSYVEEISDKPAIETVIAPCPFEAQRSDELSFIQGECLEIIEKSFNNSDWCIARNETGQIGLISNNYIENGKPNLFERLLNWIKDLSVEQNEKLKNKEITDLIMNYNKIDNSLDKSEILREAINNKQYKIYAYLQFSGIKFKDEQEYAECYIKLSFSQKIELQKEMGYYLVPIKDGHILFLVSKTKASSLRNRTPDEFKEKVEKWYRKLDEIDEISVILKVLAVRYSGLDEIIFDKERESIIGMCTLGSHTTSAETDFCAGRIILGAKMDESELLGSLAHELTRFAMRILHRNNWNPYDNGEKFEQILEKVSANTELEPIIKDVFEYYEKEEWHSELIVRIPHILAKYGKEDGIALLQTQAEDLLNYYNETILPSCRTFVQEKHLIQPRNDIELLNQYLDVLDTGADVNYCNHQSGKRAIDLAWEKSYYYTVLTLLKADSTFPNIHDKPFKIESIFNDTNVPEKLKRFLNERNALLNWIKDLSVEQNEKLKNEEITDLIMNYNYVDNTQDKSEILSEAIKNKQYKMYAYLQSKDITFNDGQEQSEIFEKLENSQKDELQKELDYYFPPIKDAHILFLVSKTKAASLRNHTPDEFKEKVEKWYRKLDEIEEISLILKVVAVRYSGLDDIIFDEQKESVRCMDVHESDTTKGFTDYFAGRISVGAKMEECELLGTLAHELTHFAMQRLYKNYGNPYDKSDNGENFENFEQILEKVLANTELDPIIKDVFKYYKKEQWHSELIVRIPHILAKYGKEDGIALLQTQAEDLLIYYNETILPNCMTFVQEKHLIQSRNDIELLDQYLDVIDAIKKSGVELKDPIQINSFLSQQKQENDFKNFLLIRTKNTLLTSCGVHQSLQEIPEYSKANNTLFLKLDQYKCSIFDIFNSDATDLLIVIYSDNHQQMQNVLKDFYEICQDKPYKKIIFIIQDSSIINFKKYLEDKSLWKDLEDKRYPKKYQETTDNKNSFTDLTTESQKKLLQECKIILQGYEISLNELIDENSKELIDSTTLVRLINNDKITIGHELISLGDTQNYYIPRTFNYQTVIKTEIFKEEKVKYLLAISDIDEATLRRLVSEGHKISWFQEYGLDKNNDIRCIILNNGQAADQFKQLCQRNPDLNIHWLKSESDQLIWQQSQGSISGLHQYIEKDVSHTKYYSETELLSQTDKVMIISDTAGMGKTTVLTSLSQLLKHQEKHRDLWIVRIDLNNYTKELQKQKIKSSFKTEDIDKAITFLSNDILKLRTPLEQAIFKNYCQKMIVMFDGFDEISPDYREIVIELMNVLRNSTIKQLWVTTRPNERDILEDRLQQLSYKLELFSKPNQVNFMTKFWQQTSGLSEVTQEQQKRLKDYAGALIDLLTKSTSDKDKEFTGIPLQIRMLAEVFVTDYKTFYNSSTGELQLPKKLDLNDLYEKFFEKKYDIYQKEKNKLDLNKPRVKILSDESYAEFIGKHQNLALCTLFKKHKLEILLSEKAYQEFSKNHPSVVESCNIEILKKSLMNKSEQEIKSFIKDIKTSTVNTGIIDQIIEDKPHFIHRTFAEYLVGKFLVSSLDNEAIVEFVLQEILLQPAYQVTRAFLNGQLPESLPENTLARYGKQIKRLWQSDKKNLYNKEGMTLLHLAAEEGTVKIIRFVLNSLKGHETIIKSLVEATTTYYYKNLTTALHLAAAGGCLDVVQCLVEHGADVNVKSNPDQSALHWAALKDNWGIVQWLVEHGADVNVKSNSNLAVLHWAAQMNKWDVVQWLVEHGKANIDAIDNDGQTVLHWAAQENKKNNLYIVKWLVEHGADVNVKSNDGKTVLHWAAQKNKWDIVQWLVEHGKANVEATDNSDRTVLHWAAQGNLLVVKWLMEHGKANVEATDNDGRTVLHWAAQGNSDVVQWLVEHGQAKVEATDNDGRTVLHWAAKENKWDIVQWLLEHGADVNVKSNDGKTVLHWAAQENKWDIVQWLVEHGKANVEVTDNNGRTMLHWAACGNLLVFKWLIENGRANVDAIDNNGRTVLHWAAQGNLDVVQWLVEHGKANVEATDNDGRTVLHWAAKENKWDVVQWLVEHKKANIEATDKNGQTVLHLAAWGNLDVVQWLVKHGKANVEATDNDGRTVLLWAVHMNKWDVVQWLVEHGKANVEATDNDGRTVLHWASLGNSDIVQWLVEHGKANVEATDSNGRTMLHWAGLGNLDVVQWLVEHGKANVEDTDNDGRTVLHWAAQGNLLVVKWLMEHGEANVEATDNDGLTVLHWATQGNLDVVQWLVEHGKANVKAIDKRGRTVLHRAAQNNKWNVVQWLVEHGVDVNVKNYDGETMLHWAAQGNLDVVQWLVEHGKANVEDTDNDGRTVLHWAAQGNLLVVKWLVEYGKANVKAIDKRGRTVLHRAAQGNLDVVQWLVEHGKANVKAIDKRGRTVLHRAAQKNKWDVVQWLVEHGTDVNVKSNDGKTVLHWAAQENKWDIVQWLVEHGKANVYATDNFGQTVLHLAAQKNKWDVVQWLVEHGVDVNVGRTTVLHWAAQGNLLIVQWLVEHGADVKAIDNSGRTVLHWAAQKNKWDVVQWLVEHGADVNVKSYVGETVLHWAAQGNLDIVLWLVERGKANVKAIDNSGRTVPYWAAKENKWDVVQWLVEHGADVNVKSYVGETVLHWASRSNLLVVQWLVEHGKANVKAIDNSGRTVLYWAAQVNKWDVVQWLVEHGADVNAESYAGNMMLHWAAQGNLVVVKWLVEYGKANVGATDNNGRTVLHRAAQVNKWDVVQWLVKHGKANVEATDKYGQTALHLAARGNLDVVQWLVEHGKANFESTYKYGQTALHSAARSNLDVIQWLVEHGKANVESVDNDGLTVLHLAARGFLDVVQWLVEHGKANVEAADNDGWTVLHWAAQENKWDVVQWLVEHGKANVEATDKYGHTVLHLAARSNLDIVQWLVEHGKANVEAIDNDFWTVLHWAVYKNKWDVVQWLVEHGADVNATDIDGKTPLNFAEERKHKKMTEYL